MKPNFNPQPPSPQTGRIRGEIRDRALVLGKHKFGEADRIVVLLTENYGKLRAVANGASRPKSKFGASTEPPCHIDVSLYRAKSDLFTIKQVALINAFSGIRNDYDRIIRASAFMEAAEALAPDEHRHQPLYKMLLGALGVVDDTNPYLTQAGFFLKLLALEGLAPETQSCVNCGESENLKSIDPKGGGTRCSICRGGVAISNDGLRIIRLILADRLAAVLQLPYDPVFEEVNRISLLLLETQLERKLRSLN